ncbi:MAG: c-type cytochrome, partial [Gemmataceae bacterium]|nr:c-type cytochrome [Gemmataceae bacterium]
YIADFYNKIIGHYEVDLKDPRRDKDRGRVWRVVWKGKDGTSPAPAFAYSDLTKAKPEEVEKLLGHPNLAVRLTATNQLIHRRVEVEARDSTPEVYKVHRMWVDEMLALRGGQLQKRGAASSPLAAAHEQRVIRAEAEWRREHPGDRVDRKQADLAKADPHVVRAAVERMGAAPHAEFVQSLVEVLKACPAEDTHLRMAARIALRNCLRDDPKAWPKDYDAIFPEIALAIPDGRAAAYLLAQIAAEKVPADKLSAASEHVARYGTAESDSTLLFQSLGRSPNADPVLAGFRGVQARGARLGSEATKRLVSDARSAIENYENNAKRGAADDGKQALWGTRVLNALPAVADHGADLNALVGARNFQLTLRFLLAPEAPDAVRIGAAEVMLRYTPDDGLDAIRKQLAEPKTPEAVRVGLLLALAGSNVRDARLDARDALKDVPYRVAVPIGLNLAGSKDGADTLFAAVKQGKAPAQLLQEKAILERLKASNVPGWEKQVADLTKNLPPLDQRVADLLKKRTTGFAAAKADVTEGAKVFTKHCAACHRVGDQGGKIAPQLDGIGVRGVERLAEDVLDPNRNVDEAFRARVITTTDDRTITALMLRVEGEVLVVADLEGKEKRIPTKDVAQNRPTMLSAMPANFGDVIPEAEFYHLLAYLLDQKAKDPPKKDK